MQWKNINCNIWIGLTIVSVNRIVRPYNTRIKITLNIVTLAIPS
jgi:hypothetical protein